MQIGKKLKRLFYKEVFWAYAMIVPLFVGLMIFYIIPCFTTLYYSFTEWGVFGGSTWTGIENYKRLIKDKEVWQALGNSFKYIVYTVPAITIISTLIAVLLNQKIKGLSLYRTLYFLPAVTMPAAIAMIWKWLYNGDYGLLNYVLSLIGIEGNRWITNPLYAMGSLAFVGIWAGIGKNIIIALAGLQSIPASYYEAASIDGAGPFRKLFNITLPLLSPSLFFILVMELMRAFQVFDLIYMMIGDNNITIDNTKSLVYIFYKYAFIINDKGYAAAIVMVLFLFILLITIIQLKLQKKWVHYS